MPDTAISFIVATETGAAACGRVLDVLRMVRTPHDEVIVLTRADQVAELPCRDDDWLRVVGVKDASVFALRARLPALAEGDWIVLLEEHSWITAAAIGAIRALIGARPDADLIAVLAKNLTSTSPWGWANFLHTFALVWAPLEGTPPFSLAPVAVVRRAALGTEALPEGGWELDVIPRLFAGGRVAFSNDIYIDHVRALGASECLALNFHNARACSGLRRKLGHPIRAVLHEAWHVVAQRPRQLRRALAPRAHELPHGMARRMQAVGVAHMLGCLAGTLLGPGRSAHAID
jgi:hypothetical protein